MKSENIKDEKEVFEDWEESRFEWLEDEILGEIDEKIEELKTEREYLRAIIRRKV